ncbi:MAG TPA: N-acetylmuramoyl-L-alanine amidase [Steroidobacteraceae bacterium]|nr:N-acetylmuramoyl-L-alanine amidase [Steroidobacteraceae bacterium]
MIRKVFQLGALILLGVGSAVVPAAAVGTAGARLSAVQLTTSAVDSRVTLDLSRVTGEKVFTLEHPFRAVIDLPRTRMRPGLRLPRAHGLVAGIRIGPRPHGALRLVVALNAVTGVHADWTYSRARGPQLILTLGKVPGAAAANAAPDAIPTPIHALHAPVDSGRDIIVAVDPGHGGQDPGAIGPRGTEEKNVTLAIARLLAQQIDAQRGMRAILTRNSDIFIPLRDRMAIARRAKADLFVSIHADCITDRQISGASVYILSVRGASSEAARWLAERENDADLKGGVQLEDKSSTLASVLLNLSQSATISESMTAARQVLVSLDHSVPVRKSQVQQAAFVVLKSPDIPSMLVETDYISDPAEERKLRNPARQLKIADAVFHGIRGYFRQHPPAGTLFAEEPKPLNRLVAGN